MPEPLKSLTDLPVETLISYDDFAHFLPGTRRENIERASREGRFPRGCRITPKKPMLFKAGDVADYLSERTASLEAGQ